MKFFTATLFIGLFASLSGVSVWAQTSFLNVSYDPTREFYQEVNKAFAAQWGQKAKQEIRFSQSHGGSGKQARSVIDGLEADVVSLALAYDIDAIANKGLIAKDWQTQFPNNATPYTSTIVFLVRKGNPKAIKNWPDLARAGVEVVTPNPKTSGGARWNYLAAWGYALKQPKGNGASARAFVQSIYQNVKVLDSGARGATTTFAERGIGDVLITWENEAFLAQNELGADKFDIVFPSISILAEPPVAIVDRNVDKHGTRALAKAYIDFLYSDQGQELAAKHYFRPRNQKAGGAYVKRFPKVALFTIDELFGNWTNASQTHFVDGGVFDQISAPK